MSLQKEIKEKIKEALKEKDQIKLNALRGLSSDIVNALVAQGKKPNEEADDSLVLSVIKKAIKQRKESAKEFRKGNREDLAEKEEKEAEIISQFMPSAPSYEEIEKIAKDCIKEHGPNTGLIMSCAMSKLGPSADGAKVKSIVDKLQSE